MEKINYNHTINSINYLKYILLGLSSYYLNFKSIFTLFYGYKFFYECREQNVNYFLLFLSWLFFGFYNTMYNILLLSAYYFFLNYNQISLKIKKLYSDLNEVIEFYKREAVNNNNLKLDQPKIVDLISKYCSYKYFLIDKLDYYKKKLLSYTIINNIKNIIWYIYELLISLDFNYYIDIINSEIIFLTNYIYKNINEIPILEVYKNSFLKILNEIMGTNNQYINKDLSEYNELNNSNDKSDNCNMEKIFKDIEKMSNINNETIINDYSKIFDSVPNMSNLLNMQNIPEITNLSNIQEMMTPVDLKNPPNLKDIEKLMNTFQDLKKISDKIDNFKFNGVNPNIPQLNKSQLKKLKKKQQKFNK